MIKKIIQIALVLVLLTANIAAVSANSSTLDRSALYDQCLNGSEEFPDSGCYDQIDPDASNRDRRQDRRACRNACNEQADQQIAEGELKPNVLPPIPQPDLLPGPNLTEDATGEDVRDFISERVLPKLANRLIAVVATISVFALVIAGLMMVFAVGNEEQLKNARKAAIFAGVGLALSLLSFFIVDLINSLNLST